MKRSLRIAAAALAASTLVGVNLAAASQASAYDLYKFAANNVNIRSTPYTNSPQIYGLGQLGQRACVMGTATGQTISDGGHTTNEWLLVKDLDTGVSPGYVWEWYITGTRIGSC